MLGIGVSTLFTYTLPLMRGELPNTATAQELFNSCAAHGGSGWDHSGMVRALEMMANHTIGGGV